MPKSSKQFIISDSQVNEYGFRILTAGVDLTQFEKNPVLLFMHFRPWKGTKDEVLALGYWTDIEKKDDQILATPFFDDADEFAMSIYHKVEAGIYKMASGGFKPLAWSDAPEDMLPGQDYSTVTKCKLKEASICDIGVNSNALALYDDNDDVINLSDKAQFSKIPFINQKATDMPELKDIAKSLNLAENSPMDVVLSTVNKLVNDNTELKTKNTDLSTQVTNLTTEVTNLKTEKSKDKIEHMLSAAVTAGKITNPQKEHYQKLAENGGIESVEALLADMPSKQSLQNLSTGQVDELGELKKLSWDELDAKDGSLARLKELDLDTFKLKFKTKFDKEYVEAK